MKTLKQSDIVIARKLNAIVSQFTRLLENPVWEDAKSTEVQEIKKMQWRLQELAEEHVPPFDAMKDYIEWLKRG